MSSRPVRHVHLGAAIALLPLGVFAQQKGVENHELSVYAGAGYTDNLERLTSGESSESILAMGGRIDWRQNTRRLEFGAKGDVAYLHYSGNSKNGELVGNLDGDLRLSLVPDQLAWIVEESLGQAQISVTAALSPENREVVNLLSTGPEWRMQLGESTEVGIEGRYGRVDYSESNLDNNRWLATGHIGHELSARSRLSLVADASRINYRSAVNRDYDSRSGFLRYDLIGARTAVTADFGRIHVKDDTGSASDYRYALTVTRRMSSAMTLSLGGGQALTDTASSLRPQSSFAPRERFAQPAVLSDGAFFRRYASAILDYTRDRSAFQVSGKVTRDEYVLNSSLVVQRREFATWLSRRLTSRWNARLGFLLVDSEYSSLLSDTDMRVSATLAYRVGRRTSLAFNGEHNNRHVKGLSGSASENRAFLMIERALR